MCRMRYHFNGLTGDYSMKLWTTPLAILLCIAMLLGLTACSSDAPEESSSVPATTSSTVPAPDIEAIYLSACSAVEKTADLSLTIDYYKDRTVGNERYLETSSISACYTGLGGSNMQALVKEDLTYGTYEASYIQSYLSGTAYCQVNDQSFKTAMPAKKFMAMQIPAILVDLSLYETVDYTQKDGNTVITFSDPSSLESWVAAPGSPELIDADGTAVLDADGTLLSTAYYAEYSVNTTVYTLDVSVEIAAPGDLDLEELQPKYPENCTTLAYFNTPKALLQVVGDVYYSKAITSSATETLQCEATSISRTRLTQVDLFDSLDEFLAKTDYAVTLTDFTNTPVTNTKTELFRNGTYCYTTNGSDPVIQDSITAEKMHIYCEDTLLSALFTPNYLASAELTDTGDFYCLTFQGTEAFTESLFDEIYRILNVELDSAASSYTTNEAVGYLTINKYTGLPTAMGMSLSRTHIIEGVSYTTSYQLDQAITLSSTTAYETITGEPLSRGKIEKNATPLFYKVTGPENQAMWVLGTIHVGDERTGCLPQKIYDALSASASLAVEFDLHTFEEQSGSDPALQSQLAAAYYYKDMSPLSAHLDSALYEKAYHLITASGNRSAKALYLKAFAWDDLISNFYTDQNYSLSTQHGVDIRLLELARTQEKPILNIESGLAQIQMFSGFSQNLQTALLSETVSTSLIDYNQEVQSLYELWCQGDETALATALAGDTAGLAQKDISLYEEYTNAMFTKRNANMASTAISYLESGETVFFAVGFAHLLGDDGILAALRNAGYTVNQVSY